MNGLKSKVLKELIDVLDQEDGKMLMKHPKVMAAKITVAKPVDKKAMEAMKDEMPEEEMGMEKEMEGEGETEGIDDILEDIGEFDQLPDDVKKKLFSMLAK